MFLKYYGIDPSGMIYTNYRVMITQMRWIDKYLKGEKVFASTAPKSKLKPAEVTDAQKRKFEQQMQSVTPTIKAAKKTKLQVTNVITKSLEEATTAI